MISAQEEAWFVLWGGLSLRVAGLEIPIPRPHTTVHDTYYKDSVPRAVHESELEAIFGRLELQAVAAT